MDLYFERHDGQAATIEDFLAGFADATGTDLTQFKLWYSQAGTPEVVAKGHYDQRQKTLHADARAERAADAGPAGEEADAHPDPLRPGRAERRGPRVRVASSGAAVEGDVIHLTEASQTIVFHGVSARPVPSLLRGFSAPVRLSIDLRRTTSSSCCAPIPTRSTAGRRRRCWRRATLIAGADRGRAARPSRSITRSSTRSATSPRTTSSSRPSARRCCNCRAKPTSPARSAATSIRTRSPRRATALRAGDRRPDRPAACRRRRAPAGDGAFSTGLPPRPAGGRSPIRRST